MPTIVKSIGTNGRDYSTLALWEADIDNAAVYAAGDTAKGEGYNDSVFTGVCVIDGGSTIGLAAIKITVASGQRHTGVAGTGCRFSSTTNSNVFRCDNNTVPIEVSWWECNTGGGTGGGTIVDGSGATAPSMTLHHLILHNAATTTATRCIQISGNSNACIVHNCILYRISSTSTGNNVIRVLDSTSQLNAQIYSNTLYNATKDNGTGDCRGIITGNNANVLVKNNIAIECNKGTTTGAKTDYSFGANPVRSHLISSDTSADGTGSITSVTAASLFVSTVSGSEDLHILVGSPAWKVGTDLGTSPTDINLDIDGFDRDAVNYPWDIGADQRLNPITASVTPMQVVVSVPPITPTLHDRATVQPVLVVISIPSVGAQVSGPGKVTTRSKTLIDVNDQSKTLTDVSARSCVIQ